MSDAGAGCGLDDTDQEREELEGLVAGALKATQEATDRAEAAEARCARLKKALEAALEVMEFAYMNAPKQPKEIGIARAALQQETGRD